MCIQVMPSHSLDVTQQATKLISLLVRRDKTNILLEFNEIVPMKDCERIVRLQTLAAVIMFTVLSRTREKNF